MSGYCGLCGGDQAEKHGKWWSPDDGWRFAPLCDFCWGEVKSAVPKAGDYAYAEQFGEEAFNDDAEYGADL